MSPYAHLDHFWRADTDLHACPNSCCWSGEAGLRNCTCCASGDVRAPSGECDWSCFCSGDVVEPPKQQCMNCKSCCDVLSSSPVPIEDQGNVTGPCSWCWS